MNLIKPAIISIILFQSGLAHSRSQYNCVIADVHGQVKNMSSMSQGYSIGNNADPDANPPEVSTAATAVCTAHPDDYQEIRMSCEMFHFSGIGINYSHKTVMQPEQLYLQSGEYAVICQYVSDYM